MTPLELVPRVAVAELRSLPEWPEMRARRTAIIGIAVHGCLHRFEVRLKSCRITFGTRWSMRCPECAGKRRAGRLHLYWFQDRLRCRECLLEGHRVCYLRHTWPESRWRRSGRTLLAGARRARSSSPRSRSQ